MNITTKTIDEIVDNEEYCPLPTDVIPNRLGINLCSVDSISWQKQEDGQLVSLSVYFKPESSTEKINKLLEEHKEAEDCDSWTGLAVKEFFNKIRKICGRREKKEKTNIKEG